VKKKKKKCGKEGLSDPALPIHFPSLLLLQEPPTVLGALLGGFANKVCWAACLVSCVSLHGATQCIVRVQHFHRPLDPVPQFLMQAFIPAAHQECRDTIGARSQMLASFITAPLMALILSAVAYNLGKKALGPTPRPAPPTAAAGGGPGGRWCSRMVAKAGGGLKA